MVSRRDGHTRVLIYSHDSFGLGHLRRCRAIAESLVQHHRELSILILSGSPLIGSFEFPARVDFVRIPGVIKLKSGEYSSHSLDMDIQDVSELRRAIIRHTAEAFRPHIFIVDKEPLGLGGEISDTLAALSDAGTRIILGLRDVMDEPAQLLAEWERKQVAPALSAWYDEIWVYGLPQICEPLEGLSLPGEVLDKVVYTGYIERRLPKYNGQSSAPFDEPFILVTTGGGGDGNELIDWVLRAYEADSDAIGKPALLLFGPFMPSPEREAFQKRVGRLDRVAALTFDAHVEALMTDASAIVAMGGYNTFCEILSFDKPALVVPRRVPRLEQFIRASRAAELGLINMLSDLDGTDASLMVNELRRLGERPPPSNVVVPGLLSGLENINRLFEGASPMRVHEESQLEAHPL
ncbi:MAG: glycosyltransferase [Pseudomonadota bacterium]